MFASSFFVMITIDRFTSGRVLRFETGCRSLQTAFAQRTGRIAADDHPRRNVLCHDRASAGDGALRDRDAGSDVAAGANPSLVLDADRRGEESHMRIGNVVRRRTEVTILGHGRMRPHMDGSDTITIDIM